jgi:hypothetical protein
MERDRDRVRGKGEGIEESGRASVKGKLVRLGDRGR